MDWERLRARIEQVRARLDASFEPGPAEVERLLRDRARRLAEPPRAESEPAGTLEVVVFTVGSERYAVESEAVAEVMALGVLTPVPGTPPHFLGVVNHRGRIVPVADLARLLDLDGGDVPAGSRVLIVEAGGAVFGILAHALVGAERLAASDVSRRRPASAGDRSTFVRGVTTAFVSVLDLAAIAASSRFIVDDGAESGQRVRQSNDAQEKQP